MADIERRPCPECGEMIAVTAKLCRFCRAMFDAEGNTLPPEARPVVTAPTPAVRPIQTKGMPRWAKILIGAGIFLMVLAVVGPMVAVMAIAIPNLSQSRMAANESAAVAACMTYAEAQDIYTRTDWDGDGIMEYAQAISGSFSLFEKTAGSADITLVDHAFAEADATSAVPIPKAGYLYKILKSQGAAAPQGEKSYIVNGNMTEGYALVAYPANYDATGLNTFLINQDGTVYQKDLGLFTDEIVDEMTEYNPDSSWVIAE